MEPITRMVVHSAFEDYDVLIDRTTRYGNRYWEFGASKDDPVEVKIKAFSKQVISDLETGKLSLWDIYNLKGKVLGCHCATPQNPDAPCHGRVLISMIPDVENVLRKNGILTDDGRRRIGQFNSSYRFLSNFYVFRHPITRQDMEFYSVEAAYQHSKYTLWEHLYDEGKCTQAPPSEYRDIPFMTPSQSKKFSSDYNMPDEVKAVFDEYKDDIMTSLVRDKYMSNPDLWTELVNTHDWELVEGNWWRDSYWGFCMHTKTGDNRLGKITMKIREELQPSSN